MTLPCAVCGKPAHIKPSYSSSYYCKADFHSLLEKRIRKDLRTHQIIDITQKYTLLHDQSPLAEITAKFLKNIFGEHLKMDIVNEGKITDHTIVPSCLEMDASILFEQFLGKKKPKLQGIRPLRRISLADINHLLGQKTIHVETHPLLLDLEAAQPGSLFGLLKLFEK
jgi:hypothetical protein